MDTNFSGAVGKKRLPLVERYVFNSAGLDGMGGIPSSPAPGEMTESDLDSLNEEINDDLDKMIMNQMICFEVYTLACLCSHLH